MKRQQYYSAKCYFSHPERRRGDEIGYEERITLFMAKNEVDAIAVAEDEAKKYADKVAARYLGFVDVYILVDLGITFNGAKEIYSMTFYDDPDEEGFLNNYYLIGGNHSEIGEL
jgi:hypothetical protein